MDGADAAFTKLSAMAASSSKVLVPHDCVDPMLLVGCALAQPLPLDVALGIWTSESEIRRQLRGYTDL